MYEISVSISIGSKSLYLSETLKRLKVFLIGRLLCLICTVPIVLLTLLVMTVQNTYWSVDPQDMDSWSIYSLDLYPI